MAKAAKDRRRPLEPFTTGQASMARPQVIEDVADAPPGTARRRFLDQSPLDRYLARGQVTRRQWAAGSRLAEDMHTAGLTPRVTPNLLSAGGGHGSTFGMAASERQFAARKRVRSALDHLGVQPRLEQVVVAVVWLESAAPAWAAELGHGRGAAGPVGMALLTLGLDSLARFYGLPE